MVIDDDQKKNEKCIIVSITDIYSTKNTMVLDENVNEVFNQIKQKSKPNDIKSGWE